MTDIMKIFQPAVIEDTDTQIMQIIEVAQIGTAVASEHWIEEKEDMFDLDLDVFTEFGDKTYDNETDLCRFLNTLTPAQLALTEVLEDDGSFVVFYPLLAVRPVAVPKSGFHFDTDYPRPTRPSVEVPELVGAAMPDQSGRGSQGSREADLALLLPSVRS